ncbi:hypothetical protein Agabi119p4_4248 [Agaricus bisporus var. burnettii]|uniref:Uncharacterized protein n=1 Tax=Agaricus bisporus var. burnettii TaxID=192524 RepID=A0A8H7F327_AGABI|nr:hypothetical protein Agabi119p4_4248 [Agaricus bisporus var. burnettii]
MTDSQPLVCVFFQLPPSQQLFTQIHDIPWLILLPQLDELSTALETFLESNPSSTAMKALLEARKAMGRKMIPLRDMMLSGRDFSRQYFEYVDNVSETRRVSEYVKRPYDVMAEKAGNKVEKAQQALSDFREELEGAVFRVTSLIGDNNGASLFITESRLIVSTMITAIEECNSLLEEFGEMFRNITKQGFDPESFEHNPPSDEECHLVSEKWQMLENVQHNISLDWNRLALRIEIPHMDRPASELIPRYTQDAVAQPGIPVNPVDLEAPPNPPPPEKMKISFWQKILQRISSCFSSKLFR